MDYTNDILARLQRGEDVNTIATELTKSINDANTRYKAEIEAKRKAEQEAKLKAAAEEAARNDKLDAAADLRDCLISLLEMYDVSAEVITELEDISAGEIVEVFDTLVPAIQKYSELMDMFKDEAYAVRPTPVGDSSVKKAASPIEEFLNKYVR